MTWGGALIPLVIFLVYAWPYITRFVVGVATREPAPPPESSAAEELGRRLATVNVEDLHPPQRAALDQRGKLASDRLHLGKLGHGVPSVRTTGFLIAADG